MNNITYYDKVYFASCSSGIENLLSKELISLGSKKNTILKGGVSFKADELTCIKIILNSRLAGKIFKKLFSSAIKEEKDIYQISKLYNWDTLFEKNQTFIINTIIKNNVIKFKNGNYLSLVLKDAIADYFNNKYGLRPSIDKVNPKISFLNLIEFEKKHFFSVYLDLCINSLNKRSYRVKSTLAPIKENLAAAILDYTHLEKHHNFVDLMCGSGTFAIEAVISKFKLPASYLNILNSKDNITNYSFFNNLIFNTNYELINSFKNYINNLISIINTKLILIDNEKNTFLANDLFTSELAKINIDKAKFSNIIKVRNVDALSIKNNFKDTGLLISNLPYGERLIKTDNFINDFIKYTKNEFNNFDIYILTEEEKNFKETLSKKQFFNGKIKTYLHKIN